MSRAGSRILNSVRAARAYAQGGPDGGFVVHVPDTVDVRGIRADLGLSQEGFAKRFGFSLAGVRRCCSQSRTAEQAARVLLLVIAHDPAASARSTAAAQTV